MNNNQTKIGVPMQRWVGFLVFLFPFLSLITPSGIGFSSLVFLLTALCVPRQAWAALAPHWRDIRWVVVAFGFNLLFALVCVLARPEARLEYLDNPSRMLFGLSAAALVVLARPPRATLWSGVVLGAACALPFVGYQRIVLGIDRPGGWLNAITFGDIALCLALVALAAAIDYRHSTRKAILPALGAVAGLAGTVMTGTRGGWIALALAAILFLTYAHLLRSRRVRLLLVGSFALFASTFFIPAAGVQARVGQGIDDVRTWLDGGSAFTNVGVRLELWKAAGYLIEERPLFGRDPEAVRAGLRQLASEGKIQDVILPAEHLHNDALQALATGGIFGLLAWIGILAMPFAFFARVLGREAQMDKPQFAPALAGMLVVLSYFSFGLTEVIFWSLKGSMFYTLMVFLLMGFCLNVKDGSDKPIGK
ncbi:O-antigen ligase family protein [Telluria aromaticivorans]|uniref:O-antigen ligase family protein n=1 Tax=Telluria aromaticivorans TaxID=2725995 RepID=A0A7Y2JYV4_9BURK|nr:O-antigen ligase family protein [Telluria aromaticivorans]NNG22923.1 O-antigen ligase family protein [Telluria aromaticivorans]